ncbi:beta-xylosidase [Saccharothrix sp. NPDC042600]|uniref:beta-xylosidase n=1 Tax=Saccharothrix TaxID=2071 RepID=UPI00340E65A6
MDTTRHGLSAAAVITARPSPDESVGVDFSVTGGAPTHRASGCIYGMTEDASAPPDGFFHDVRFRALRAGGAQLDSPGGWVSGRYDRRWRATRAQLLRARALGGEFVLLPHDLWGADGHPIARFPGDDGDWTDYDDFLSRVVADVRATRAPVRWDLWNEPDLAAFWNRPQAQYLELWRRTHRRVRAEFPTHAVVGPSTAGAPTTESGWWTRFLDFACAHDVVPDVVSWHTLPGDPVATAAAADASLTARGIRRPYQINEYGAAAEQHPAGGAWYVARLERAGVDGLRANWAAGGDLHDDLAGLLVRDASGRHRPRGEWWVYRFYGTQTGVTASVTPGVDHDAFATKTIGGAKVLVGGRATGDVVVGLRRLDTTSGIVVDDRVRVLVERIPHNGGAAVDGPVTVRDAVVTLTDNGTTVRLPHHTAEDAFTITLLPAR